MAADAKEPDRPFFGREKEKKALVDAVLRDYRRGFKSWAVLGNRGVGKTETVRKAAAELVKKHKGSGKQLVVLEMHPDQEEMERRFLSGMTEAEEAGQITAKLANELRQLQPGPGEPDSLATRYTRRAEHLLKQGHGVCLDEFQHADGQGYNRESWGKAMIDDLDNRKVSGTLIISGSYQQKLSDMLTDPSRAMGGRISGACMVRIDPLIGKALFQFAEHNGWTPRQLASVHAVSDGNPRKMWELADAVRGKDFAMLQSDATAWHAQLLRYETVQSKDKTLNFAGRMIKGSGLGQLGDIPWSVLQALAGAEGRAVHWTNLSKAARDHVHEARGKTYEDDEEWERVFHHEMLILMEAELLRSTRGAKIWELDRFQVTSGNLLLHLLAGERPADVDQDDLAERFGRAAGGIAFEELTRWNLHWRAELLAGERGYVRSQRGRPLPGGGDLDAMASVYEEVPRERHPKGRDQRLVAMLEASCKRSWQGFFHRNEETGAVLSHKEAIFDDFRRAMDSRREFLCGRELGYLTDEEKANSDGALEKKTRKILAATEFDSMPDDKRAELKEQGTDEFLDIRAMAEELGIGLRSDA